MIGFLIENGNDQQMVNNINTFAKNQLCHVFSASLIPTLQTTVMQRYEAFHFNGKIITNSFRLSQQLRHLGYCKERYYYIQNYEWTNAQHLPYSIIKNTLLHPSIKLIVQDSSQAKLIEELTNKKVKYVMNNWDINVLRQIADE
jgi:hypothetical protein